MVHYNGAPALVQCDSRWADEPNGGQYGRLLYAERDRQRQQNLCLTNKQKAISCSTLDH